MSISPQPNLWQCGPFALKHALVALGVFADEHQITKIARTRSSYGTDEVQLARAAKSFDCRLPLVRRHEAEQARRELMSYLRKGIPALICVHEWSHWVTVVKAERSRFIILDSRDDAVLTIVSWADFRNRWVYYEQDEVDPEYWHSFYDFHPVVPKSRVRTKAKFSIARAKFLRRKENRTLARNWDEYVVDLLTICKPRTSLSTQVMSMGEFFRRHEELILNQVDYWHGGIERGHADKVLSNMHFVADTYGLVIHKEDEKRAIAGITAILSLWAAAGYGANPVYE